MQLLTKNIARYAILLIFTFCLVSVSTYAQLLTDYRAGVFSAAFPYKSKYIKIKEHRLHYIDEGKGDLFLFLHGNPTSSYLWRNVMRYVKPSGRIIALDNIGFGKSDQPENLDYNFQTHYQYVEGFINKLNLQNVTLVVHDWGSVLGLHYAVNNSKNIKGVVFMEAIIPPTFPAKSLVTFGPAADLLHKFRAPNLGKTLLIDQNIFIEGLLLKGAITRNLSAAEKTVYRKPFINPKKRFPIYVFPNELPVGGEPARNARVISNIGKWLKTSEVPKLVQYASPGIMIPPKAAEWMTKNYRNIESQFVGYGLHFIQEDNPEAIGRGIADWHRRNFDTNR